jgi:polyribonucleotide nucleotidyltransferase
VEYQEKTYAAGKIPGGFFKREGRPSEKEILTARLIDRPIRPLFPKGYKDEVQGIALVLSSDCQNDSDVLALIGASCVLNISNIPFDGLIGAARVGRINGEFVVNPTFAQIAESDVDLMVVGSQDGVVMLEGTSKECDEAAMRQAVDFGYENAKKVISFIEEIKKECGQEKYTPVIKEIDAEFRAKVEELTSGEIDKINALDKKDKRKEATKALIADVAEKLITEDSEYTEKEIKSVMSDIEKVKVRKMILEQGKRSDGRGFKDIREISCEVGVLPRTHGSGLFTRGETQSLAVTTLGTSADEQIIDALVEKSYKGFMLHYNFPPFSVGEVKPVRGPGRREIGHGALAERSLKQMLPSKDDFPYTIRIVSEVLESNGSSSMATVCAGTLSLMDAGVPIKAPVGGVALGLVKEGDKAKILTDIAGSEDHYGDMDFKAAGTEKGITAIQMDLKITGISLDLIDKIMEQSREARLAILGKITGLISAPKSDISEFAPKIVTIKINPSKIGELIGPGGKNIKKITADTGATIDIEDDGTVRIGATDGAVSDKAVEAVKAITAEVEVGKIYNGKVKRIMDFGAFCEVLPGKEGLVHVSELSDEYVGKVDDAVKIGDEFEVKVIEVDSQGRVNLSKKQAADGPGTPRPSTRERRPSRGRERGHGRPPRRDKGRY